MVFGPSARCNRLSGNRKRARGHDHERVRTALAVRSGLQVRWRPLPDGTHAPNSLAKNEGAGFGADAALRFLRDVRFFIVFFLAFFLAGRDDLRLFLLRAAMLRLAFFFAFDLDFELDFDFRFLDFAINRLPECLR